MVPHLNGLIIIKYMKSLVKLQILILIATFLLKLADKFLLNFICNWILNYPGAESVEIYWWQKFHYLEPYIWNFIDYVESK